MKALPFKALLFGVFLCFMIPDGAMSAELEKPISNFTINFFK